VPCQRVGCRSSRRRSPKRSGLEGSGLAGLPKQVRGARRRVGACRSRSVPFRAGIRCRPRPASGDPRDEESGQPKLSGPSGPVARPAEAGVRGTGRCRVGRGEPPSDIPGRSGLTSHRSGNGAGGPCPGSRRGSDPPKRTPTSSRGTRAREVRGQSAEAVWSVPSRAPEFVVPVPRTPLPGSKGRRPPGERPSSRPCSTDESVAMSRRFQRCIARVSHGLVSPSRSSLFRCCPAVARCRSTLCPSGRLRAEARGVPWEGVSVRSPGPKQVGPFPRSELRGGFRSIPSWVARDAPNGDCSPSWFRRYAPEVCPGARVASRCPPPRPPLPEGVSTGPSRRPPWGF
jgi:hypothetical protein